MQHIAKLSLKCQLLVTRIARPPAAVAYSASRKDTKIRNFFREIETIFAVFNLLSRIVNVGFRTTIKKVMMTTVECFCQMSI